MNKETKINPPKIFPKIVHDNSWDIWLEKTQKKLEDHGFKIYHQNHKREDFAYWKRYSINGKDVYQIGILFYDWRKYSYTDPGANTIGIQFECLFIGIDSRIDLTVSKNIELIEFEEMARAFYNSMIIYTK